ncbi:MAG: exodeoxyribonuclease V subunit alpha [Gemmatimonadetes bacterium]|nr:exodeoxyribonuclease V subunit alpha [Gemmatimonadota bacterium]
MSVTSLVPGLPALAPWRAAGLVSEADEALVRVLLDAAGVDAHVTPEVPLALALAIRAARLGHVCLTLSTVAQDAIREAGIEADEADDGGDDDYPAPGDAATALPWPHPHAWRAALAASPLVAVVGADALMATAVRPLVLEGDRLYLARLWHDERQVAERLRALAQRHALTMVTGGPGSGKTTRIARQLVAGMKDHPGDAPPTVTLTAPTGKAAARMGEALRLALAREGADPALQERLRASHPVTLHTLLGARPDSDQRWTRHAANPLACDLLVIDELSMVSLSLLARTLDALPDAAQLMLVGDPDQLASVAAGTVLADLVRGASANPTLRAGHTHLTGSHRFTPDAGIGALAAAINGNRADEAVALLKAGDAQVHWVNPGATWRGALPAAVLERLVAQARAVAAHAAAGDGVAALAELHRLRTLCAHRAGPSGASTVNAAVDRALRLPFGDAWPVGRPVLVTRNNRALGVANGDLGVVVHADEGRRVAFPATEGVRRLAPARLEAVDTVHAMTIHKAQGSEFDEVVVVLPPEGSPLLSRELLYTAITRARQRVTVVATEGAVRAAVGRAVARGSGLAERLAER